MAELRIEEDFVLSSSEDSELALEPSQVAAQPVHKVSTYFFRMLLAASGSEAGRINLRVGSTPHIELYGGHKGSRFILFTAEIAVRRGRYGFGGHWCANFGSIRSGSPAIPRTFNHGRVANWRRPYSLRP
jgi:hypothetical protein